MNLENQVEISPNVIQLKDEFVKFGKVGFTDPKYVPRNQFSIQHR